MIEVFNGRSPCEYLCDSCMHKLRFIFSQTGEIRGVFCMNIHESIFPAPKLCSDYISGEREIAMDQKSLSEW